MARDTVWVVDCMGGTNEHWRDVADMIEPSRSYVTCKKTVLPDNCLSRRPIKHFRSETKTHVSVILASSSVKIILVTGTVLY